MRLGSLLLAAVCLGSVVGGGLLTGACSFDNGGIGDDTVDGRDDDDPDAAIDGGGDSAVDGADSGPSCTLACEGNQLRTCDPEDPGDEGTLTPCVLGCSEVDGAHCQVVVPSNGATVDDLEGVSGELTVDSDLIVFINTDTGEITSHRGDDEDSETVREPNDDPAAFEVLAGMGFRVIDAGTAVLAVDAVTVDATTRELVTEAIIGGYLAALGDRALILLSRGPVVIRGFVDVSAGCFVGEEFVRACAGPGGGRGAEAQGETAGGCAPGRNGLPPSASSPGAGGGGFGSSGAKGGTAGASIGGAGGNQAACDPSDDLVPLRGGSGGGWAAGATGGGGGGALQITSLDSITVETIVVGFDETARLHAGGQGGRGTVEVTGAPDNGGGGGGSGGGLLLEAPVVSLGTSNVLAQGGAGGSGRTTTPGGDGEAGSAAGTVTAKGGPGTGGGNNNGRGGNGAIEGVAATAGDDDADGGGGGGAGVGIIRINTPGEADLVIEGAAISPAHVRGALGVQ